MLRRPRCSSKKSRPPSERRSARPRSASRRASASSCKTRSCNTRSMVIEMRRQRANTFVGISDFLLALNNVIFILFIFAIMAMAAKVPPASGVEVKAEYLITAEWDLDHDCDVDLWVRDPLGNIVYYGQKESGSMHLDHDSRGHLSDEERLPDGTIVKPRIYSETATLRGIVPGEYTVNIHLYGAWTGSNAMDHTPGTPYSVPVHVRITKLNPSA